MKQLQNQALGELQRGHFNAADQILHKAAALSHDPAAEQMADWSSSFNVQLQASAAERNKQYQQLVSQAKLLEQNGLLEHAILIASQACQLAEDRGVFAKQPWVDQLINESIRRAAADDQAGQWTDSLRVYSSLAVIQPSVPRWNVESRLAGRRLRLLIMYLPDGLQTLERGEAKAHEAVVRLLNQPAASAGTGSTPTTRFPAETSLSELLKVEPTSSSGMMLFVEHACRCSGRR